MTKKIVRTNFFTTNSGQQTKICTININKSNWKKMSFFIHSLVISIDKKIGVTPALLSPYKGLLYIYLGLSLSTILPLLHFPIHPNVLPTSILFCPFLHFTWHDDLFSIYSSDYLLNITPWFHGLCIYPFPLPSAQVHSYTIFKPTLNWTVHALNVPIQNQSLFRTLSVLHHRLSSLFLLC